MMRLPDPRERPWLTVAELSEITGDGEKAIRSAIAADQIPHLSVGRYIRVPTATFAALVGITDSSEPADGESAGFALTSIQGDGSEVNPDDQPAA